MKSFFQAIIMLGIIFAIFSTITGCGEKPTQIVQTVIEKHYYHEHERGTIPFNIVLTGWKSVLPKIKTIHINGWDKTFAQTDTMYTNIGDSVYLKMIFAYSEECDTNFIIQDTTTYFFSHTADSLGFWTYSASLVNR